MNPVKTQLKRGLYLSPGFYMHYWVNCIERNYSVDVIARHGKLKQHREVWIGAILAAWQTKVSGIKHFVGIPEREPPDVEIVRYERIVTPSGRVGTKMGKIGFELTRCSMDDGETIFEQILKKNKHANKNISLVIYTYGSNVETDFNALQKEIDSLSLIYPHEIIVAGPVLGTKKIKFPIGTFGITKLYPTKGQDTVSLNDLGSFFMSPNLKIPTGLGVSSQAKRLGQIELMPPIIKGKKI